MLNNIPTTYNNVLYPSKAEAKYAQHLDKLKAQGKVLWWRRQVPFKVYDTNKVLTMIVDFVVMYRNRREIHEVKKGFYSQEFIYKLGLWIQNYPYFDYYIIEEDRKGIFTYKTPKQFLNIREKEEVSIRPVSIIPKRKYNWFEIALSYGFHSIAGLFFK